MKEKLDSINTVPLAESILTIFGYAENHNSTELLQKFLDEAERLTNSQIGFYHLVSADQVNLTLTAWSTNTKEIMCKMDAAGAHYPISEAGVWVDCVKTGAPVIHNDYASLKHKKGLPKDHAPIIREIVVPVIRDGIVMAILGVGNKASYYTQDDQEVLETLAQMAWETISRRQQTDEIQKMLQTKEILLREVHHRIRNNLHLLSVLLTIQADHLEPRESRGALLEAKTRIESIQSVYDCLFVQEYTGEVNLNILLEHICQAIVETSPRPIEFSMEIPELSISADHVTHLGIVVNEWITNSMKYAVPMDGNLKLKVKAYRSGAEDSNHPPLDGRSELVIEFSDNGEKWNISSPKRGLGSQVIAFMVEAMRGEWKVHWDGGTNQSLILPI